MQAVLLPHDVPNNVAGWVDTGNARGTVLPLPVGDIGLEDNLLLRRHLARGPVTIEAELQNEVSGSTPVSNVIAEITGGELPHEWVLVGAHLDSWDLGTGAQDNGMGVVMVLEAARAIASLRKPPRRSIQFALWAAEEPGPPGGAVVAVTTYAISDQRTRLAPHVGQDAVQQILRAARLDVDLVYSLWRP